MKRCHHPKHEGGRSCFRWRRVGREELWMGQLVGSATAKPDVCLANRSTHDMLVHTQGHLLRSHQGFLPTKAAQLQGIFSGPRWRPVRHALGAHHRARCNLTGNGGGVRRSRNESGVRVVRDAVRAVAWALFGLHGAFMVSAVTFL